MPAYWLSAFRNPAALLEIFRMEAAVQQSKLERGSGYLEPVVAFTEMTSRDREHVRHATLLPSALPFHISAS